MNRYLFVTNLYSSKFIFFDFLIHLISCDKTLTILCNIRGIFDYFFFKILDKAYLCKGVIFHKINPFSYHFNQID